MDNFYHILNSRGFIHDATRPGFVESLPLHSKAYIGFDPTADSLHVGSLIPIMALDWFQKCGHDPIILIGDATALVGDPTGKSQMRKMLTHEEIIINADKISSQLARILKGDNIKVLNNGSWLKSLNWIGLLRTVGQHISVNEMLSLDSVKSRMSSDGGISFLEFNYMVMQAYDFLHLAKTFDCRLQLGGSDQWGNILAGINLIHTTETNGVAHGLTFPILTDENGNKFGKSEKGTIWLSEDKTSVFDFFQFWRNVPDSRVEKYLKLFTQLPLSDISTLLEEINVAKEVLSFEVTKFVHGEDAAQKASDAAKVLFKEKTIADLESLPTITMKWKDFCTSETNRGVGLLSLMVKVGAATSNNVARQLVVGKAVRINDVLIQNPQYDVTSHEDFIYENTEERDEFGDPDPKNHTGYLILQIGKKKFYRVNLEFEETPKQTPQGHILSTYLLASGPGWVYSRLKGFPEKHLPNKENAISTLLNAEHNASLMSDEIGTECLIALAKLIKDGTLDPIIEREFFNTSIRWWKELVEYFKKDLNKSENEV